MSDSSKRAELEIKAQEAVERLERSRSLGRQLELLPSAAAPEPVGELEGESAPRGPGRPPGARNKSTSALRRMLAARGHRMPEDVLTELAGLASRDNAIDLAISRAELVLDWAFGDAAPQPEDPGKAARGPTGGQRLAAFLAVLKEQTAAACALLPYGLEKVSPDATGAPTFIVLPGGAASQPGDRARIVEHAPPPMPGEEPSDASGNGPHSPVNHTKAR